MEIACSKECYDKLDKADIFPRTQEVKEGLQTVFLYKSIWEGKPQELISEIKKSNLESLAEDKADILALEKRLDAESFITWIDPFVYENPFLVARLVFGDDLNNFQAFGFNSKQAFARAVSAYCITERRQIEGDKTVHCWRNDYYKNQIHLVTHGDFSAVQTRITGKPGEYVLVNPQSEGFGLQQDWSPFLVTALKYAQALDQQNIPDIRNWRELASQVRTSNPWGTSIPEVGETDFDIECLFLDGLTSADHPLSLKKGIVPYFNEGRLEILGENPQGDVSLYGGRLKFSRFMTYLPQDLPHLLKANYQLFARSLDDMAQIMDYFNTLNLSNKVSLR